MNETKLHVTTEAVISMGAEIHRLRESTSRLEVRATVAEAEAERLRERVAELEAAGRALVEDLIDGRDGQAVVRSRDFKRLVQCAGPRKEGEA